MPFPCSESETQISNDFGKKKKVYLTDEQYVAYRKDYHQSQTPKYLYEVTGSIEMPGTREWSTAGMHFLFRNNMTLVLFVFKTSQSWDSCDCIQSKASCDCSETILMVWAFALLMEALNQLPNLRKHSQSSLVRLSRSSPRLVPLM